MIISGIAAAISGALFAGSALATSLIGGALTFGLQLGMKYLNRPKKQKYAAVQGEVQFGADVPVGTLFGTGLVAGHRWFYAKWGSGNKVNADVFGLANGWCDGLEPYVYFYGEKHNLVERDPIGGEAAHYGIEGFGNRVSIRFYDGRPGQPADMKLVNDTANLGKTWKATSVAAGMAYVVVERTFNADLFDKGRPEFEWVLRGLRLYDPRKDSTIAGGAGPHRIDNPATWQHSLNPAVQRLNYQLGLRGMISGRTMVGEGKSIGQLDLGTYFAAMNVCDSLRNGKPTYQSSIWVDGEMDHTEILKEFDDAMAGYALNRRGLSGVIPGAPQIPVLEITADDIPVDRAKDVQLRKSAFDLYNYISGQFTSIESMWKPESLSPVYVNADIAADGRRRQTANDFLQVTDPDIAQYLLNIRYRQNRKGGTATVPVSRRVGLAVQEGEWVTFRGKTWLVTEWQVDEQFRFTLKLAETGADIYDDGDIEPGPIVIPPTQPINPSLLSTVQNFDVQAGMINGASGHDVPCLQFTWTPPEDPSIVAVRIFYRQAESADDLLVTCTEPESGKFITTDGIVSGTVYNARATITTVPDRLKTFTPWRTTLTATGNMNVLDGSITSAKIAEAAVTASKIMDEAVTNLKLADEAVSTAKLQVGAVTQQIIANGAVVADKIANAAITIAKFASGLRPIEVLAALPTTGNTEGRQVYLTTEGKLYRYHAGAWTAAMDADDIEGTLSNAQIESLAASKITGQLTNSQIADLAAAKISGQLTNAQIADIAAAKLTGTLVSSQIADGAMTIAKFASSLRPVEVLAALPSTGNSEGRQVFLTTDGKLYRYHAGAWTAAIDADDIEGTLSNAQIESLAASKITGQLADAQIAAVAATKVTGQITSTQISDNAISTPKLAAGAITTAKIAAGAVTADEIAANAVTAAKIQAGAVEAAKIAAGAVVADKIAAGAVTTAKLDALAVTADKLAANSVVAGKIAAAAVSATEIVAGAITAGKLAVVDTTNMIGGELLDADAWAGINNNPSWSLFTSGASQDDYGRVLGYNLASSTGGSAFGYLSEVNSKPFPVVPGQAYAVGGKVRGYSVARGRANFGVLFYDKDGVQLSFTMLLTHDMTGSSNTSTLATIVTAPANATTGVFRCRTARDANGEWAPQAIFRGMYVRQAASAELIVDGAIVADKIATNAVTTEKIAAEAVVADTIASNAITSAKISAGAITTAKIAAGAVTADEIATNAVTAGKLQTGSVETAKIAAGAVVADKIAAGAVTTAKLDALAVTADKLAANSVVAGKIAAAAVSATEVAAGAIIASKIAVMDLSNLVSGDLLDGQAWGLPKADWLIGTSSSGSDEFQRYIRWSGTFNGGANAFVSDIYSARFSAMPGQQYALGGKVRAFGGSTGNARLAIWWYDKDGTAISSSTFLNADINVSQATTVAANVIVVAPSNAVEGAVQVRAAADASGSASGGFLFRSIYVRRAASAELIVDGSVVAEKIAANAVTTAKIAAGAVTANEIAAGAITAIKIAAGTITGDKLAANTIGANQIAANAITAKQLVLTDFSNLIPDNLLQDASVWGGSQSNFAIAAGGVNETAERVWRWAGDSPGAANGFVADVYTARFPIDPTKQYAFGGTYRTWAASNGGASTRLYYYDAAGTALSSTTVAEFAVGGTTAERTYSRMVTPPAGAVSAALQLRRARDASGNCSGNVFWYNTFARVAVNAEFIVDGAITADKLNVNSLSAITANFGSANFSGEARSTNGKLVLDFTNGGIELWG
ncbi:MAG: hypothetical protein QHC90_25955 [Shinella sp.]|nr:hypothetical protein [Shinella sp.]